MAACSQRRECEEPPIQFRRKSRIPVAGTGGVARKGVVEHAERADGAEEGVADAPEGGRLAIKELGAGDAANDGRISDLWT